jgi:hypothetical protein
MPVYCFESASGEVIEKFFKVGCAPRCIERKGIRYRRSYGAERVGVPPPSNWPMKCIASAVSPEQANELRDTFKNAGVPTEVTPDGCPVYRNAGHRKEALKCRGMFDRSSYN